MNRNFLMAAIALAVAVTALAAFFLMPKKTAYINTNDLYASFQATKERGQILEKIKNEQKLVLDSMMLDIRSAKESNSLKPDMMKSMEVNFLRRQQEVQQQLSSQSQAYEEEIWKQLNQYVIDYGKERGYDYIFGATGNGSLMYSSEGENITTQLIEYANSRYDGK